MKNQLAKPSNPPSHAEQRRLIGFPPWVVGDNMTNEGPDSESPDGTVDDDWHLFASASYGSAEAEPAEAMEIEETPEDEWFDGDDHIHSGASIDWEAPPCPAPLGIAHVIKIGTCDNCLHRIGGRRVDSTGAEGGAMLRAEAHSRDSELEKAEIPELCPLCENLFEDVINIVDRIVESTNDYEYSTMQFGIHLPKDMIQSEDSIRTKHGAQGSKPLKSSFVKSIQEEISSRIQGVSFVKESPDIMITIDALTLRVDVDVRPIFIYGRYRKLERGIPQTRWPCRACRGRGGDCENCKGTGLQYTESVQDLIGEPVRSTMDANDTSFHGMGREDIDVRCLGSGRPFVLELKGPRSRKTDLEELSEKINSEASGKVEVNSLRWSQKREVSRIKETRSEKSYTIRFKAGEELPEGDVIEAISALSGRVLEQETPKRVSHRRAAKTRKRTVTSISDILVEGDEIQFSLRCEAGTYVKELVHSDEGRTTPSVKEVLGTECEVLWLDVEDIHSD